MDIHAAIRAKFQVEDDDNLPLTGRAATRDRMAELFAELGSCKGAEIGVGQGFYSEILCKANPNLCLLGIDPWVGISTPVRRAIRPENATQANLETYGDVDPLYADAVQRLAPYNITLIRAGSIDAVQNIPDASLDFVYIDAVHSFDWAMTDILYWAPKVRLGGIVSGHDFAHYHEYGVVFAVEAYVRAHRISPWYITNCDAGPSWLWVKEHN